jgi:hypothetical protein
MRPNSGLYVVSGPQVLELSHALQEYAKKLETSDRQSETGRRVGKRPAVFG